MYRCWAPTGVSLPGSWSWGRHLLGVQRLGNGFQRVPAGVHLEYTPDDLSISLVHFKAHSVRALHVPVAVAAPTGVQPPKDFAFESAMRLLCQFLDIERIHETVDRD